MTSDQQPSSGTASSRWGLAGMALSGSTASSSGVAASPVPPGPSPSPGQMATARTSMPATGIAATAGSTGNRAIDALEALASAADSSRSKPPSSTRHDKSRSRERTLADPALPRNASSSAFSAVNPGSSSISAFLENGSHFFGPGAFSFEGDSAFRSFPTTGSPSLFGSQKYYQADSWMRRVGSPSEEANSLARPQPSIGSQQSFDGSSPSSSNFSFVKHESSVGGGKKLKDMSRCLKFSVSAGLRDRGMVGLAKPPDGDKSRVAVAGRTCLRILHVPHGGRRRGREAQISSLAKQNNSIAYRRSRSRGVSADPSLEDAGESKDRDEVREILDVRSNSRLGPAYLFTDVRWGYGASAHRIATSFSNGAVALWDLNTSVDPTRVTYQSKYEHDRAVNRVVFGGQSGSWLMSGGQDGQMKLQGGGAIDRITGHVGSCLAMDWRDSHDGERQDTAGGNREGGWVATGGVDKTIKIWDFSLPTLSTKPVRVLHASQPVQAVAWHPTRATEVASCALPLLSSEAAVDESWPPPSEKEVSHQSNVWKNEIDVWDSRRTRFPRLSIKTDEPLSALTYNDDDTLWSVTKQSTIFSQHDVDSDSYSLLDCVDRPAAAWSAMGDLLFAEHASGPSIKTGTDSAFVSKAADAVDAAPIRTETFLSNVVNIDPDFQANTFSYLANNLVIGDMPFAEMCTINAEVSSMAGRPDCKQLWQTIRIWCQDLDAQTQPQDRAVPQESSLSASPALEAPSPAFGTLKMLPPLLARLGASDTPRMRALELPSDADVPSISKPPSLHVSDSPAESGSQTPVLFSGYGYYDTLSTPSSDSERATPMVRRSSVRGSQLTTSSLPPHSDTLDKTLSTARGRDADSASDSDSDEGDGDDRRRRALARKAQTSNAAAVLESSLLLRRGSLQSQGEDPERHSRQLSREPTWSSNGRAASGHAQRSTEQNQRRESAQRAAVLARSQGLRNDQQGRKILSDRFMDILQVYADHGDYQLCATVSCALQGQAIDIPPFFVLRATKAYLTHLRAVGLHVAAANINKHCSAPQLRALTQNSVTLHTSCGKCGKSLDQQPFGLCRRCANLSTECCICHRIIKSVVVWCAGCGHGGHATCLQAFATGLSAGDGKLTDGPPSYIDVSHPSTPGIAIPLRRWLWGADETDDGKEDDGENPMLLNRPDRVQKLQTCPHGSSHEKFAWALDEGRGSENGDTPALTAVEATDHSKKRSDGQPCSVDAARVSSSMDRDERRGRIDSSASPLVDGPGQRYPQQYARFEYTHDVIYQPGPYQPYAQTNVLPHTLHHAQSYSYEAGPSSVVPPNWVALDQFNDGRLSFPQRPNHSLIISTPMPPTASVSEGNSREDSVRSASHSDRQHSASPPGSPGKDRPPASVTPFITKLALLLDTPGNSEFIRWNNEGTAFTFANKSTKLLEEFSKLFRHNKLASFIRQLNIYGFIRMSQAEVSQVCEQFAASRESDWTGFWQGANGNRRKHAGGSKRSANAVASLAA
ncbi:SEA (Seh1-associated) complex subunit [Microbotryomycetes sp. JL201]|nr:SEA (Seh1-associated) complex subunit [Microbotryomycetes sp. JL201]